MSVCLHKMNYDILPNIKGYRWRPINQADLDALILFDQVRGVNLLDTDCRDAEGGVCLQTTGLEEPDDIIEDLDSALQGV